MLAAQYLVGTLAGSARKRFERYLLDDADLRNLVAQWSDRMNVLGANLPKEPAPNLLPSIKKRLGLGEIGRQVQPQKKGLFQFWRSLAVITSVASLVLVMVVLQVQQPSSPQAFDNIVSLLNDKTKIQTVMVKTDLAARVMTVKILKAQKVSVQKDLELWVVTANSPVPKSLGVIPASGSKEIKLTDQQIAWLKNAKALAVSIEPKGGSPTGVPTGPIPYSGAIHLL